MEQRRHDRFPVLLKIRLDRGEGVVQNVSAGGISFVTDVRLEIGQELTFQLEFPYVLGGSIGATCTARIVRTEIKSTQYGIGASISAFEFRRLPHRIAQSVHDRGEVGPCGSRSEPLSAG